ncbi:hypothetical protein B0H17DRAFT_1128496 [Mycena rosella]|uniref:Uncharacterized protein n=1 Tax=Mycena rosella TaxID=1033263 RepID=A0AAD7DW88_MYCRO|nr:hypothetical protein B0H17DRAFT_1128496 [Mycena rosella]
MFRLAPSKLLRRSLLIHGLVHAPIYYPPGVLRSALNVPLLMRGLRRHSTHPVSVFDARDYTTWYIPPVSLRLGPGNRTLHTEYGIIGPIEPLAFLPNALTYDQITVFVFFANGTHYSFSDGYGVRQFAGAFGSRVEFLRRLRDDESNDFWESARCVPWLDDLHESVDEDGWPGAPAVTISPKDFKVWSKTSVELPGCWFCDWDQWEFRRSTCLLEALLIADLSVAPVTGAIELLAFVPWGLRDSFEFMGRKDDKVFVFALNGEYYFFCAYRARVTQFKGPFVSHDDFLQRLDDKELWAQQELLPLWRE